jgi:uncharacterized protein
MQKLAHWLLIIGGVNWLLVGLLGSDLFMLLQMEMTSWLPRIVYILVGISAIVTLMPAKSSTPQM